LLVVLEPNLSLDSAKVFRLQVISVHSRQLNRAIAEWQRISVEVINITWKRFRYSQKKSPERSEKSFFSKMKYWLKPSVSNH